MLNIVCLGFLLLLLASCASAPPTADIEVVDAGAVENQPAEVPLETQTEAPVAAPAQPAPDRSYAVDELLTQARLQYRYGQYQYAVRTAERGLRIDRAQSEWYLILSQSYLKLGSPGNAQQFARQGLRYSSPVGQHYQRLKQISDGQF